MEQNLIYIQLTFNIVIVINLFVIIIVFNRVIKKIKDDILILRTGIGIINLIRTIENP